MPNPNDKSKDQRQNQNPHQPGKDQQRQDPNKRNL